MMSKYRTNYDDLNDMVKILLDMMDIAAEDGINFESRLGSGCLAFTAHVQRGIAQIAELKHNYASYMRGYEDEKEDNKELRRILKEAFGDENFDCFPDEVKADILEYSRKRIKEWDDMANDEKAND